MNSPLVSIIVPCYNQAQYLPETLDSVLAQTYPHWECIIVNDGSPDNTAEIAQQYCAKDKRFKYVYKENGGLSSARNAGLQIIEGEYVQFLDSDDLIDARKFELQLEEFEKDENLMISISNFKYYDVLIGYYLPNEWNNCLSSDVKNDILYRWDNNFSIPIHTALIKSSSVKNILFNENLFAKEDWLFWVDLVICKNHFKYIDMTLAIYRVNPLSMTQNKNLMYKNTIKVLFLIFEKLNDTDKNRFIKRIENEIQNIYDDNIYEINSLEKIQISYAYRLGKKITKPFSVIKRNIKLLIQ